MFSVVCAEHGFSQMRHARMLVAFSRHTRVWRSVGVLQEVYQLARNGKDEPLESEPVAVHSCTRWHLATWTFIELRVMCTACWMRRGQRPQWDYTLLLEAAMKAQRKQARP